METLRKILADNDTALWGVTFVGVCVLVGLGKIKPETVEYMMMAIVGRASLGKRTPDAPKEETK